MGGKGDLIEYLRTHGAGQGNNGHESGSEGTGKVLIGEVVENVPRLDPSDPDFVRKEFNGIYHRVSQRLDADEAKDTAERLYASRLMTAMRSVPVKSTDTQEEILRKYDRYREQMEEEGERMNRAAMGASTEEIERSKQYDKGLRYIDQYRDSNIEYQQAVRLIRGLPIQPWEKRDLLNQLAQESALKPTPDDEARINPIVAGVAALVVICGGCAGWTWWVELTR